MGSNLGDRSAIGKKDVNNRNPANFITPGAWVITFTPEELPSDTDFEMWHGAVRGPGGYFLVYLDDKLYGVGENGLINEYAPSIAMYIRKGQTITLHWSTATGNAPTAWLYFRQPEVGRI